MDKIQLLDLTIQLVNYKTKRYLLTCLESLLKDLKDASFKWEINILDNDSGDDLSDLEKQYSKDPIHFYYSDKNLGFGTGHNFLAKKSQADYILILNTDLKFTENNTVNSLLQNCISDNTIKVVGPALITPQNKIQLWDHGESQGFLATISLNSYWKKHSNSCEVAWVSGAVLLIERKIFNEISGFDEKMFLYGEDVDLCFRVRKLGWKILYDPTVRVHHYGGAVGRRNDYVRKSNDYYLDKHFRRHPLYWLFKTVNRILPYF
ncbi:MAG: glycosyltransferase family 2 protein [Candidatus Daviesbacteria bacterium]|nr:glycosyltransferase family 2 protein [Candidatus Daviesbacteria bacterium]